MFSSHSFNNKLIYFMFMHFRHYITDLDVAIARYNRIDDHDTHPVSVLVNRSAFNVLFPSLSADAAKNGEKASGGNGVTQSAADDEEAELEELRRRVRVHFFSL
jgi:hypothetical protein